MGYKIPESIDTWASVNGVEHEVLVFFDYQPEEFDPPATESVTVTSVIFEDQGCLLDEMQDSELRDLEGRVLESLRDMADSWGECA